MTLREEDALFSARGHFEAAKPWTRAHFWIGIPTAILAAIAGLSIVNDKPEYALWLTLFVTGLAAISTFLNPRERANAHQVAGAKMNSIRNQTRILREVELEIGLLPEDAVDRLKKLSKARDDLNLSSPQIPRRAFERGRRSIEAGEASYSVDTEPNSNV